MPFCTHCGNKVEAGEQFCSSCGKALENRTDPEGDWGNKADQLIGKINPRKISLLVFVLALLCLFLPFVTVSCQGQEIVTLSTMNLAVGTDVQGETIHGNAFALLILILILVGIALYFWKADLSYLASAGAALLCFILLIILRVNISNAVTKEVGQEMFVSIDTKSRAGFYLLFILTLAGTALNSYIVKKENILEKIKKRPVAYR